MSISSLDEKLAVILRPLVEMEAIMRVSPYVNTLPLGFHYVLAHDPGSPPPDDRVALAEWNRVDVADLEKHLNGVFIFYGPKNQADKFRALTGVPGFFNSVPVTQFLQRSVFVRRNPVAESLVNSANGKLGPFFKEAVASGSDLTIYTDIIEQAQKLVELTNHGSRVASQVRFVEPALPARLTSTRAPLPVFIYGAPCIAYMSRTSDTFISMEVDESKIRAVPQYETHVIWHVPENGADLNSQIRNCVIAYHQCLFDAAENTANEEFSAMSAACSDVLAARHPSFQAEIFADPKTFRTCLRNHHSEPLSNTPINSKAA